MLAAAASLVLLMAPTTVLAHERRTVADGKFNAVEPVNGLQFPVQLGDPSQSAAAVQAVQADAQSARTLAYIGIGIGILGLLAAMGALFFRPRAPAPRPSTRTARERV